MPDPISNANDTRFTSVKWLICIIAAIGFGFDIYELLMLPLILRPALMELGGLTPGSPGFVHWFSLLFYVPAVAGGVFGLLGGYLTDRLGRRRVLTWSILLYAFGAFAAGFSTSLGMLLFFRSLVFIGVCVEFVAAVAWLAELFSDPKQREKVIGFTQAFSSLGGIAVAFASSICVAYAKEWPGIQLPGFLSFLGEIKDPHAAWRYTLMSGLLPAIPLIIIRPFLPESPVWKKRRDEGTLRRPSIAQLFAPELRRTTIITTLMFTCSFAAAFGAIQQMPQIAPGLPEVVAETKAAVEKDFPPAAQDAMKKALAAQGKTPEEIKKAVGAKIGPIKGPIEQRHASDITKVQELGGLAGRVILAIVVLVIVSRRGQLRLFLIPGLFVMPVVFGWAAVTGINELKIGMFFAGLFTVAQFSFWGNYLPHVFPVHLRGTGEAFAANVGGRLIGTMFAAVTQYLALLLPMQATNPAAAVAYTAAGVAFTVYLINLIASFWLPEPKAEALPE